MRVLWIEREEREKTVTDLAWAVARRGRVGCGEEHQARSRRSGVKVGRAVRVAEVGMVEVPQAAGGAWLLSRKVSVSEE